MFDPDVAERRIVMHLLDEVVNKAARELIDQGIGNGSVERRTLSDLLSRNDAVDVVFVWLSRCPESRDSLLSNEDIWVHYRNC